MARKTEYDKTIGLYIEKDLYTWLMEKSLHDRKETLDACKELLRDMMENERDENIQMTINQINEQ